MVTEIRPRLGTNIFISVVVSLFTAKHRFLQLHLCHFIFTTKICY